MIETWATTDRYYFHVYNQALLNGWDIAALHFTEQGHDPEMDEVIEEYRIAMKKFSKLLVARLEQENEDYFKNLSKEALEAWKVKNDEFNAQFS